MSTLKNACNLLGLSRFWAGASCLATESDQPFTTGNCCRYTRQAETDGAHARCRGGFALAISAFIFVLLLVSASSSSSSSSSLVRHVLFLNLAHVPLLRKDWGLSIAVLEVQFICRSVLATAQLLFFRCSVCLVAQHARGGRLS